MKISLVYLLLIVSMGMGLPQPADYTLVACGRVLADLRSLLCYDEENQTQKMRSIKDTQMPSTTDKNEPLWTDWQDKQSLSKLIPGFVDECCLKPCSVEELLAYC